MKAIQFNFDPKNAVKAMNQLLEDIKAHPKSDANQLALFEDIKTLVDLGFSTLSKFPTNPESGKTKN